MGGKDESVVVAEGGEAVAPAPLFLRLISPPRESRWRRGGSKGYEEEGKEMEATR